MGGLKVAGFGGSTGLGCGCCAPPSCITTVCVHVCGLAFSGATVTVKNGGTPVVSGVTNSSGCVDLDVGTAGTYDVTTTIAGADRCTKSLSLTCGGTTTILLAQIRVHGCTDVLPGATVSVAGQADQTTDSGGIAYYCQASGSYAYSIARSRFTTATGTWNGTACLDVTLTPASGYQCACGCNIPVCNTLQLTDSVIGSCTLTYDATYALWWGTVVYNFPGSCGCPTKAGVNVVYQWTGGTGGGCAVAVNFPKFSAPPNLCTAGAIQNCPQTGAQVPAPTSIVASVGLSVSCDPLHVVGSINVCTCSNCFGAVQNPCSGGTPANGLTALWVQSNPTITLTDTC